MTKSYEMMMDGIFVCMFLKLFAVAIVIVDDDAANGKFC